MGFVEFLRSYRSVESDQLFSQCQPWSLYNSLVAIKLRSTAIGRHNYIEFTLQSDTTRTPSGTRVEDLVAATYWGTVVLKLRVEPMHGNNPPDPDLAAGI
jgi:hypothetical protein